MPKFTQVGSSKVITRQIGETTVTKHEGVLSAGAQLMGLVEDGTPLFVQISDGQEQLTKDQIFDTLTTRYVQQQDERQKSMGLQYMTAETHDLAEFFSSLFIRAGEVPSRKQTLEPSDILKAVENAAAAKGKFMPVLTLDQSKLLCVALNAILVGDK